MNKKNNVFSHFGFSTILVIFIMLCMATFATLSLLSANSDYKLSKKAADKTTGYYKADTIARNYLYNADMYLAQTDTKAYSENEYFQQMSVLIDNIEIPDGMNKNDITYDEHNGVLSFSVFISDNQSLYVSVQLLYSTDINSSFYKVTCWQTKASLAPEDNENGMHLLGD